MLFAILTLVALPTVRAEDLTVLTTQNADGEPRQMLGRYLKRQSDLALEKRLAAFEQVKTPEDAEAYTKQRREFFLEQLGGFPERTPLHPKTVGTMAGDGYRVEKIIFESQPRHFVTALLYVPEGAPPFPAVLMPCGHTATGKTENQTHGIFLAKSGIAALCYDPIGQGERYQLLDAAGKPRFRSTEEHTLVGASSILLGRSTASYRVWDGIRAIDYLVSRKDIDPKKVGVSGCSGGGTLSSYLMALDDRIACAAPSCYLTSWRRLIDTIGPQDAEQNIPGQIAFGLDHADYLLLRAPKPTLILAATQDFFDIQGTWETYRQATRWYTRLGFPERVGLVETDTKHGYPKPQREAMVRWMRRWLLGRDEPVNEPAITNRPPEELLCTPRGQSLLLDSARSVVDLNVELNTELELRRRKIWEPGDRREALAAVRRVAGIRPLSELPRPRTSRLGLIERENYRIETLLFECLPDSNIEHPVLEPGRIPLTRPSGTLSPTGGEGRGEGARRALESDSEIYLPALLFQPSKPSGRRILYLHGDGKHADAQPGGAIEKLVQAGHLVLAADVRGIGETGATRENLWGGDSRDFFLAYLLGKSIVGQRAEDVLVCARYLAEFENPTGGARVNLISIGATGPAALHAAALECQLFDSLNLTRSLRSWTEVVRYPAAPGQLVNVVHGALRTYDLPDLLRVLTLIQVTVIEPLDLAALARPNP